MTVAPPLPPGCGRQWPHCGRPHFAPTNNGVRVCGRNRTEAREREWAEGTVSSLPGTLNFRIKFCHSSGIARSGGGVRARHVIFRKMANQNQTDTNEMATVITFRTAVGRAIRRKSYCRTACTTLIISSYSGFNPIGDSSFVYYKK